MQNLSEGVTTKHPKDTKAEDKRGVSLALTCVHRRPGFRRSKGGVFSGLSGVSWAQSLGRFSSHELKYGFDLNRDIPRQRPHAHGAAGTDPVGFAKHLGEQLAAPVDHFRMIKEIRR